MKRTGRFKALGGAILAGLLLAGCGGGSDDRPSAAPPPPSSPPPPPPDSTATDFDTQEFRRSDGLDNINALPAFEEGGSGEGITVGIVDTGIDADHIDLAANVSPASADVVTSRDAPLAEDDDGHGTIVAGIVGAPRNDIGIMGVAFRSTLLAARADLPGTCDDEEDGCRFSDSTIAAGIRLALDNGARVINLSLGGESFGLQVREAVRAAAAAGAVVVISAGNESEIDPSGFAQIADDPIARGSVLIVGATDQADQLAGFSNQAGNLAEFFLVAPGVDIVSTFPDQKCDPGPGVCLARASGTSFASPHVAGAVAVLAQLFPNLTGREIVEILLMTARDLGDPGRDAIFGNGLLDLGAAVQPIGTTSVATSEDGSKSTPAGDGMATTSGAFGDAFVRSGVFRDVLILDRFDRSFRADLGGAVRTAPGTPPLLSLVRHTRRIEGGDVTLGAHARFTFSVHERDDRALYANLDNFAQAHRAQPRPAAFFIQRIDDRNSIALAYGFSAARLLAGSHESDPADGFALSDRIDTPFPGGSSNSRSMRVRHLLGPATRLDIALSHAEDDGGRHAISSSSFADVATTTAVAQLGTRIGRASFDLQIGGRKEDGALLGTRTSEAFSLGKGAETGFLALDAGMSLSPVWHAFARLVHAVTDSAGTPSPLFDEIPDLSSRSFAAGIRGADLFSAGDRLGLAILQPLRVSGGDTTVRVPVERDFDTDRFLFEDRRLAFSPSGREIDIELSYAFTALDVVRIEASLIQQFDPGHVAGARPVTSVLLRARTRF